ncbi:uncharacterized protein MYCFIDRAFT_84283 [Pseudocercospora fijiensis CIRAD86]|uniref:Uncharacterized protein n=1 Tax=Pseudocercospora fijiensis (strain CIRAD86) TaxID=383855 RepID=M2ZDI1_PSEFD|nr:uncharacterized protein MYCFIDRAFT_84283 [Pseudocercospora fijiensis CIRAD86]EME77159.1 hypothetical protein MYCFIDRAFT_84283 [Pseudocercospora fijiensis CIRAD86]
MPVTYALQTQLDQCPNCKIKHAHPIAEPRKVPCQIFLTQAAYNPNITIKKLKEGFLRVWNTLACDRCHGVEALKQAMLGLWVTRTLVGHGRVPTQNSTVIDLTTDNKENEEEDLPSCGVCFDLLATEPSVVNCHQCRQGLHLSCFAEFATNKTHNITAEDLVDADVTLVDPETGEIQDLAYKITCPYCRASMCRVQVPRGIVEGLVREQLTEEELLRAQNEDQATEHGTDHGEEDFDM